MNSIELDKWIENSPYTEREEVIILLHKQQAEIGELIKVCAVFEDFLIGPTAWTQEEVDNLITQVSTILRKASEK